MALQQAKTRAPHSTNGTAFHTANGDTPSAQGPSGPLEGPLQNGAHAQHNTAIQQTHTPQNKHAPPHNQHAPKRTLPGYSAADSAEADALYRSGSQAQHTGKQRPVGGALKAGFALVLWMLASSGLIVVNKVLMVDRKFRYPLFLTASGQLASAVAGLMHRAWARQGPPEGVSWAFLLSNIGPVAACAALTLFLGNYAYLFLTMSFIQILKAFTPACTFLVGVSLGLERLEPLLVLSVVAISAGTGISTLLESGTASFHWLGFASFMASVVTEAVRVLVVQRLMKAVKLGTWDVSLYLGAPTALFLYAASALFERHGLLESGLHVLWQTLDVFAAAMFASCALNAISYWAIALTSGLTLKIAGCVKNVLVVWVGMLQGDHVGQAEFGGYGLSMAGFLLYTYAQHLSGSRARKRKDM